MLSCHLYSLTVLLCSSLWVIVCRRLGKSSFQWLSLAMFIPSAVALAFNKDPEFWSNVYGKGEAAPSTVFSVFGGFIIILQLAATSGINYVSGWGIEQADAKKTPEGSGDLFMGFFRAVGEEIGWRCFLLQQLMKHYNPVLAVLISGVAWGVFHLPMMFMLMKKPHVTHPWKSCLCQFLHRILQSFLLSWLARKAEYAIWPQAVAHFVWNRINPVIFGSMYTQKQGKIMGPVWKVNGEGLAGCLAILPFALVFGWRLAAS
ncbi:hypothetical protein CAPTEDRAFT_227764 [Capitella teleta]|uniref:CAAX prenyl protease 2/Lysostaphin resistance protein A-like domain-containing protein n=1 Tax=Capitella teleta TaxID=283909 RepID=R7T3C0_CAPTE|nr:hypothetical protein CAPTEDRAFT_227764 [Capitella teleta]|eukprot:ELT87091.1 hypothetical protein CAPTEDRAFT_227764 [Capitella teleta]